MNLAEAASAIVCTSKPRLIVCVNRDGLSRPLNDSEQRELDELLGRERSSGSEVH
jgi:hypothetical protein